MSIVIVGLSHRTAPVQAREQVAFSREGVSAALMLFKSRFPDCEAAILSTCNRVEVIASGDPSVISLPQMVSFISQARSLPAEHFEQFLYQHKGSAALEHLFSVVGGLDSMVLGECQIVNQLKQAYELAQEQGTAGPTLHRLFHHAFGVSKRLRTETTIGTGALSLPSVAVEIIRREMPDFAQTRILILGAGEIAQLSIQYLKKQGASDLAIVSRNLANAKALATACNGEAHGFHELDEQLALASVVIAATACPQPILTPPRIHRARLARILRTMMLIDLAVPRNIDPGVINMDGVTLYDVDALGGIAADNQNERAGQISACKEIIDEEVESFQKWIAQRRAGPLIERLCGDVRAMAGVELRSFHRRCPGLSAEQREQIDSLVERLVNKLMHPCISAVRDQSLAGFDFNPDRHFPDSSSASASMSHGHQLATATS